ncbi:MAG TPA: hypothetical protein VG407_12630 [Caulobacteraceae bacterium]|jgi:hypothetical protein|nr:hypothetical protein [Caulobacteraceae bacterium]
MKRVLLAVLLLAGCASNHGQKPVTVLCPVQPTAYSLADERALRAEYDALPDTSQLKRWIRDYIAERRSLRACSGAP